MFKYMEKEIKLSIDNDRENLNQKYKNNFIPLSPKETLFFNNNLDILKTGNERYILLGTSGNGLITNFLFKYKKRNYIVCIYGLVGDKQEIIYIRDINRAINPPPDSPIPENSRKRFNKNKKNDFKKQRLKLF